MTQDAEFHADARLFEQFGFGLAAVNFAGILALLSVGSEQFDLNLAACVDHFAWSLAFFAGTGFLGVLMQREDSGLFHPITFWVGFVELMGGGLALLFALSDLLEHFKVERWQRNLMTIALVVPAVLSLLLWVIRKVRR
ncbi:hypothetical protein [Paraburkholderia sp. BL17N1]|uniref:hypothetical protein n=1 Tax=Paraburkholderia sp. BL17N1 TaxID=1938798 RepID=UPI000EB04CD5|nr:hypothetical protein [Paraburkholderia sp. BL17N1]RKR45927.1 hypothetical protein B0G82_3592 [Paraburkholderia sp. BL17N1]